MTLFLLLQLTALTEEALKHRQIITMNQLSWSKKKRRKIRIISRGWVGLPHRRLKAFWRHRHNIFISRDQICNDTSWFNCAPVSMSTLLERSAGAQVEIRLNVLCQHVWRLFELIELTLLEGITQKVLNIHKKIKCIKETHGKSWMICLYVYMRIAHIMFSLCCVKGMIRVCVYVILWSNIIMLS